MALPVADAVAAALLPGASRRPGGWLVTEAACERALRLWFGERWTGDPARPDSTGPEGPDPVLALMAADIAAIAAEPTQMNLPIHWPGLRMRALSVLSARRSPAPVHLRQGFAASEVEVLVRRLPYARYFDVEDVTLRHPTFAGGLSEPVLRSCLRSADAVTVLPYDPVADRVLLVEQFRPAAFLRGDPRPWVLEPVAGRCDRDEPPQDVALREAQEEAGLTLRSLEQIAAYYPSPGALTEYLTSFVGVCDLSDHAEGLHGLETEGEDIRTHILTFDEAFGLIATGEADNGPLLLSLFWLQANRARLRAG